MLIKTGFSASFTSLRQYFEHALTNHDGYSVYAFPEELERFKNGLPLANDYQQKLKQRYKDNLKKSKHYQHKITMQTNPRLKVREFAETPLEDSTIWPLLERM